MPRTKIPEGILAADIIAAASLFSSESVSRDFHESEKFDVIVEGKRFPPKAILGLAAMRILGAPLKPRDFSGGEDSQCFKLLRSMGFEVLLKEPPSAWIFQGNPDQFDIDGFLADSEEVEWAVRQKHYASMMKVGQFVFLWKAAGKRKEQSGIVAVSEIVTEPREVDEDTGARKFWRTDQPIGPLLRVKLKVRRRFLGENVLAAASVAESGSLGDLPIFALRTSTNYPLSRSHFEALNQLTGGESSQILLSETERAELFAPESDPEKLDHKVRRIKSLSDLPRPDGVNNPLRTTRSVELIERSPLVKAWVLREANGVCQLCEQIGPFKDRDGQPFLEVHHIKPLAESGEDSVSNAVALCPNCHRRCHYGSDRQEIAVKLTLLRRDA
jgi:hypothetical protein